MDMGMMIKAILTAVMMIVIVTIVVIPVLQTTSETTLTNETTEYATYDIPTGTFTPVSGGYKIDGGDVIELGDNQAAIISDSFALVHVSTAFTIVNFATETATAVQAVTIDGTAKTYSATYGGETYTGSIGNNPMMRYTSGELGAYNATAFKVTRGTDVYTFFQSPTSGSGEYRAFRGIIAGPADDLKVIAGYAYGGANREFVTSGSAVISDGLTEHGANFEIRANPTITVTVTIQGAEKTYTSTAGQIVPIAPLTYQEAAGGNDAISSLLDLVPLLLIIGVIVMVIAVAIFRT